MSLLQAVGATTMREALLCEARLRLEKWYGNPAMLDFPKFRDGVTLQITKEGLMCGGDKVIVTFGTFNVTGATGIDVFNALTDLERQKEWDTMVGSSVKLADFPGLRARGFAMSFVAHPFADREVYQWQVANTTDLKDLWVAFSTRTNDLLKTKKPAEKGAVDTQNCLGSYRVKTLPDGTVQVFFTTQVNSHPWLLSAAFVFNLVWGKTVDYIVGLRIQAQKLAAARAGQTPSINLPDFMLRDIQSSWLFWKPSQEEELVRPPFASCYAPGSEWARSEAASSDFALSPDFTLDQLPWGPIALVAIAAGGVCLCVAQILRTKRTRIYSEDGESLMSRLGLTSTSPSNQRRQRSGSYSSDEASE